MFQLDTELFDKVFEENLKGRVYDSSDSKIYDNISVIVSELNKVKVSIPTLPDFANRIKVEGELEINGKVIKVVILLDTGGITENSILNKKLYNEIKDLLNENQIMKSKIHLSGFNGKSDGIQETVIVKEALISFRYISNETMCYSSKVNIPFTVSDLGNTDIIIGLVTIAKYFHKDMCNILLELGKLGKQLVDKEENKFVNKLVTHQDTDKVVKEEFSEVSSMIQINMITAVVSDDSESGNTDDTDDPSLVTPDIVQINELVDAMNAIVVNASPELANDLRILNAEVDFEKYNELLQDCLEEFQNEEDIAVIALRTIHKLRTSILIHVLKNVHNFGVSWNTSFNQTVFNTNQSFVLYSFNDVGILGWLVFGAKRYSMEKVFEVLNYVLDNNCGNILLLSPTTLLLLLLLLLLLPLLLLP
jgi:hypothetical protein